MEQAVEAQTAHGPKFTLNIEGRDVPWNSDTITAEQIASLGGWETEPGRDRSR